MKKTIALLLALITILSVALVSCGDKKENNDAGLDDGLVANNNSTDGEDTDDEDDDDEYDEIEYDDSSFSELTGKAYAVWNVNKRVEPSRASTSLGVVNKFDVVELLEISDDERWYKVKHGEDTCYVVAKYFSTDAGIMTYDDFEESEIKTVYIDVEETIRLRVTPNYDIDENVDGIIERDTAVQQIGLSTSGTIAKIKYNNKVYYMNVKYLSDEPVGEFDPEKDNNQSGNDQAAG
ncbi:MAG: hypothetical protein J6Q78_02050 [Clostridia bacterium]|nr:hypothetical protein [Clostridia bacterium]